MHHQERDAFCIDDAQMGNVAYPAYERKENEKAFAMLKYSQFDVSLELTAKANQSPLPFLWCRHCCMVRNILVQLQKKL